MRSVALAFGGVCVCLSVALAAFALYGGASAETSAPPAPGPRAEDSQTAVSSPVASSEELPSSADSGALGSGALAGSGEPDSGEPDSGEPDSGEPDSGEPDSGETDSGETDADETGSGETGSEEAAQSGGQHQDKQEAAVNEQPSEDAGTDDAGTEDAGTEPRPQGEDADPDEAGQVSDSSGEDSGTRSADRPSLGSSEDVARTPEPAQIEAPEDKTMRLTIPAMARVEGTEVSNAAYDDRAALDESVLHPEGTGFPWHKSANVYIAGHRLGYPATGSFLIFRDLHTLTAGDAVYLTDSKGREYRYEVYEKEVVDPDHTAVMDEREGENIVTLQTCTLPDYTQRLIVRAVKVEG